MDRLNFYSRKIKIPHRILVRHWGRMVVVVLWLPAELFIQTTGCWQHRGSAAWSVLNQTTIGSLFYCPETKEYEDSPQQDLSDMVQSFICSFEPGTIMFTCCRQYLSGQLNVSQGRATNDTVLFGWRMALFSLGWGTDVLWQLTNDRHIPRGKWKWQFLGVGHQCYLLIR